jgi:uncharacterized HAD superfamily protein
MNTCKECDKELTPDEIIACGKCGNEYCSACGEAYKTICEDTTCGNVVCEDCWDYCEKHEKTFCFDCKCPEC